MFPAYLVRLPLVATQRGVTCGKVVPVGAASMAAPPLT